MDVADSTQSSRKYYFVQISTGVSTWEVPTEPAPTVPTPGSTPAQPQGPFEAPGAQDRYDDKMEGARGLNGNSTGQETQGGERGLGV